MGRDAEATELTRRLDQILTGQSGLVLVGGEPGVGKTRLARELMATERQRGYLCLTGHCYEMEGAAPVPFVEMIEQGVRLLPQAARAAMARWPPRSRRSRRACASATATSRPCPRCPPTSSGA